MIKKRITVEVTIEVDVWGEWTKYFPATRETPEEPSYFEIDRFEVDADNTDDMVGMALEDVDWQAEFEE